MSEFDNIKKDILESAKKMGQSRTSGYDTTATVTRVEGSTAWVHIPGGVIETPAQLTISAKAGDAVQVRVADGSAWITGNATAPPTDDAKAIAATTIATGAQRSAEIANAAAESAQESAAIAAEAATEAMASATTANTAANGALTQLSVVEDVVGVLTWISNHGVYTASTDTEVMPGKFYFTRSGSAGSYTYTVVTNPTGNPSTQGYYELSSVDEAVSNYVASHLALTNAGLWVIKDNQGYKSLMANDGMKIYDATGNLVATFGESITFSSSRPQYIGNSTAYLSFTPNSNTMELHGKVYADGGQIGGWYIDDYLWYQREESGVIDTTWLDGDRIYGKRQTSGIAASVGYELNTKGELELYGRDAGSPSLTITKTMGNIRKYGILYENSILFQQNNPSYNISLDAGTDGTNGTLTLGGTPGNVYFIAPNIKATAGLYIGTASVANSITGITRSGTTFTATRLDGTTFTFTQQDNNTTYTAGTGLTLSGTQFNLSDNELAYRQYAKTVSTDFNGITAPGIYVLDGTTMTNAPSGYTWSKLIVLMEGGWGQQIVSGNNFIYQRGFTGSPGAWSAWSAILTSGNYNSYALPLTGGTLSGNLIAKVESGEAQVVASNGTHRIYLYCNSNGASGIYAFKADGTGYSVISTANGAITSTFNGHATSDLPLTGGTLTGALTVTGTLAGYDYSGTSHVMVGSAADASHRVGYLYHQNPTTVRVYGQAGGSGYTTYTTLTGTSSSDIRLKKNVADTEIANALSVINQIEMRSFDWLPGWRDYDHQPIGMIADQIEKLDSRLVIGGGYDPDGEPNYKVIDDHYLICYLTKAVQELSAEIKALKGVA